MAAAFSLLLEARFASSTLDKSDRIFFVTNVAFLAFAHIWGQYITAVYVKEKSTTFLKEFLRKFAI